MRIDRDLSVGTLDYKQKKGGCYPSLQKSHNSSGVDTL